MKHNEDRRERSEKSDAKVQVRTGMKAGTDYALLIPVNVVSTGETTETETATAP